MREIIGNQDVVAGDTFLENELIRRRAPPALSETGFRELS